MADFVAVLRKTLEGLGDPDAALRARVYDKARATVAGKLAALNPPPTPGVVERQQRSLEEAIAAVERGYAESGPAAEDPLSELESVFASLKNPQPKPLAPRTPTAEASSQAHAHPAEILPAAEELPPEQELRPEQDLPPGEEPAPAEMRRHREDDPIPPAEPGRAGDRAAGKDEGRTFDRPAAGQPRRRGFGKFLAAAVVLAMLAGGAFGIWLNKDAFGDLLGLGGTETVQIASVPPADDEPQPEPSPRADASTESAEAPATPDPAAAEPAEPAGPETVAAAAQAPEPAAPPAAPAAEIGKFTQRLTTEGTETDPGPAGGETGVGEGTSVAALTQPPAPTPPAAPEDGGAAPPDQAMAAAGTAGQQAAQTDPAEGNSPEPVEAVAAAREETAAGPAAVQVGQKAIFYEERTSAAEGSAEPGSIVWSLVQESPGGSLPPEPAIRAEATIPGKDVQLRMTIKRNADQSLPASHIIEMIFLTPEGFEGGGIENILRVAMKSSEQEAGNPLIGIPAKIADGFFLVALNDTKAEIDANLTLLRRQSWIDVPLVYKSGRRALLTMEKGIPGDKVFDEAMKAWQAATAG